MVSNLSLSIATSLLGSSASQGSIDYSSLFGSSSGSTATYSVGGVDVALKQAENNETKQIAQVAKDPQVKKAIARYTKVVQNAKTLNDVLNDPVAREVFLKANGLGDQVDSVGLAKKALMSDPTDANSVANKMSSINGNWLSTVKKYNFELVGVGALQVSDAIKEVTDNYVSEKRLDMLDQQMPGLGTAILFKKDASSFDSTIKILGSALGREVVVTALGLPKQIALQSLDAQTKAVEQRMDVKKLQKPAFVDQLVRRYLIQLNGGTSGVTA